MSILSSRLAVLMVATAAMSTTYSEPEPDPQPEPDPEPEPWPEPPATLEWYDTQPPRPELRAGLPEGRTWIRARPLRIRQMASGAEDAKRAGRRREREARRRQRGRR